MHSLGDQTLAMSSLAKESVTASSTSGNPPVTTPVLPCAPPLVIGAPRKRSLAGLPDTPAAPISAILHDDPKRSRARQQQLNKNQPLVMREQPSQKQVSLFSHLVQFDRDVGLSSRLIRGKVVIHPSIMRLGLLYADYKVVGASARCRAMLLAFKDVIRDYQLPSEQVLARHLESYFRPLISFLVESRPLAVSMSQAIRYVKLRISTVCPDTHESDAKKELYEAIDGFIQNRLDLADHLIVQHGLTKIVDGDVILTFARSQVVRDLLIAAHRMGKRFRVIIVDARPFLEGKRLLCELVEAGMKGCCTYVNINALGYIIKEVTKTIIGAHCIYSNGALIRGKEEITDEAVDDIQDHG